jgi:WS/DGAT/MGAT family acyltransferase
MLERAPQFEPLCELVAARLHLEPRLRRRLIVPGRRLGAPYWTDDEDFRLDQHIRAVKVEGPAGRAELLARVEALRQRRLDRAHPLWDLTLLTGLDDGTAALLVRSHHVLADGGATLAIFTRILSEQVPGASPVPWHPSAPPTDAELRDDDRERRAARRRAAWAQLLHPRRLARTVLDGVGRTTALFAKVERHTAPRLNRTIGTRRTMALAELDLGRVAEAGHSRSGTVNDVLLAVTGAGLRRTVLSMDEDVDGLDIDVFVPVSLRADAAGRGNLISEFPVAVPVGEPNAGMRLALIAERTRVLKSGTHPSLGTLLRSRAVRWVFRRFVADSWHPVNITTANLRGPVSPLDIAGVTVVAIYPLVALVANVTIAVGAISYDGRLFMALTADHDTVHDLEPFTDGVRAELDALAPPATQ